MGLKGGYTSNIKGRGGVYLLQTQDISQANLKTSLILTLLQTPTIFESNLKSSLISIYQPY